MKEESYIRNVKYFLEELIRGCGIMITIQMKSITAC